jgi:hypothetical protein
MSLLCMQREIWLLSGHSSIVNFMSKALSTIQVAVTLLGLTKRSRSWQPRKLG